MTDIERLAGNPSPSGRPTPHAEPELSAQDSARQSYWAVVGRAYWRSLQTRSATAWAIVLLFLTIFMPFLANDAPYTTLIGGQRQYPLFRNLTREDLIWLVAGAAGVAFFWFFRKTRRKNLEIEQIRTLRLKAFLWIASIAIVITAGILCFKTDFLDKNNYHDLASAGKLQHALYAPIRWGYQDQEMATYSFPNSTHFLGTDSNGRDVLARLLWGSRVVLEIGLVSEVIALFIGAIYGALMGYFVGKVDILGMRLVEIVEAIPLLFLLITFVALFGRQLFMIMVIIGVTGWTGIARFVRAEFLRIRRLDYVTAAQALGLPVRNILFRHMLPNGLTPVIVTFTFGVAGNIVSESILSFLGIGVVPPTASWGSMLDQAGNPGIEFRWWLALPPGIMIFLTVLSYNIMGEGLRDAIDPRTNKSE
jgi:peptide/nickel transport system permease protein